MGEAVLTAVFYENITPVQKLKWETPHEIRFGRKCDYGWLCVFGCKAYVNIPKAKRKGKFGKNTKEGILVGYRLGIPNWCILMPGHQVEFSHDVIFDKNVLPGISTDEPAGLILPTFSEEELDHSTVFLQGSA